jgi:hypothetical protein
MLLRLLGLPAMATDGNDATLAPALVARARPSR